MGEPSQGILMAKGSARDLISKAMPRQLEDLSRVCLFSITRARKKTEGFNCVIFMRERNATYIGPKCWHFLKSDIYITYNIGHKVYIIISFTLNS